MTKKTKDIENPKFSFYGPTLNIHGHVYITRKSGADSVLIPNYALFMTGPSVIVLQVLHIALSSWVLFLR